LPVTPKTRVEIYIPDRPWDPSYRKTLDWIADEFTYVGAGGASVIEGIDGRYLSLHTGRTIYDRASIVYSDFPADWFTEDEREKIVGYLEDLKQFSEAVLWQEETILIAAYPLFHIV
jgi:hypothetical protein